jgi:PhoH-like ATPase
MPLPKAPERPASTVDKKKSVLAKRANRPTAKTKPTEPATKPKTARATVPAAPAAREKSNERNFESPLAKGKADGSTSELARQTDRLKTAARRGTSRRRQSRSDKAKLFVLDTNVMMHDPTCLFRFAEHDVYLPIVTLEELDNHKKGVSEVARNVRHVSRTLDSLLLDAANEIENGVSLGSDEHPAGRLFVQNQTMSYELPDVLPADKADNNILSVVAALKSTRPDREVVLVSKDINMRIKATMLGLPAEDYFNDQVIEDSDLLDSGVVKLPTDFWDNAKDIESWQDAGHTYYRLTGSALVESLKLNQFVTLDGEMPLSAQVTERTNRHVVLRTTRDFSNAKNAVWSISARNREQNFALNLLMDREIDFVTLLGQAGTGKTLLALAAGLVQVMDHDRYTEIIVTRATVAVGDDIGYLPGTEQEKMQPWMGALEDNLEVLTGRGSTGGQWGREASDDIIQSRISIKSLSFMRGRTFTNKFLIIDEAQNLTPKQMKTLITRAGPGTKVVCLGNVGQIDTPYLTEASSGLTFVVDRMRGWAHAGHITLERGERSRLAEHAADTL